MSDPPDSIGFVYEDAVLRIAGVPRSTRQNWVRAGLVASPDDGVYRERDVVETVVVSMLVRALASLREVGSLWRTRGPDVISALLPTTESDQVVALLEPRVLRLEIASAGDGVASVLRPHETTVLLPIGVAAGEARDAFWRLAYTEVRRPDARRRANRASVTRNRRKSGDQ